MEWFAELRETDPKVYNAMVHEIARQDEKLELIASENFVAYSVLQALGQGTVIRFRSGRETWHYLYRKGIAPGWDDVPYIGLITSRLDRPTKELVILFDGAGVLRRWSMQEFRTAPSKGA